MDKICAIVDCQGFQFKDRFVAREVAIVSDKLSQCQELNPMMNWRELSEEEQQVVLHSTKFKHGLYYCPFNPQDYCFLYHSDKIATVLSQWYNFVASEEKPLFAYKNHQIGKILIDNQILCIDLEKDLNFPAYEKIQAKYGCNYLCAYHKRPPRGMLYTCALRKCGQLYRELKERIEWDIME